MSTTQTTPQADEAFIRDAMETALRYIQFTANGKQDLLEQKLEQALEKLSAVHTSSTSTDPVRALVDRWRAAADTLDDEGDYQASKLPRHYADTLEAALNSPTPIKLPADLFELAQQATPGQVQARVIERHGEIIDAFLVVPSIVEYTTAAGDVPMHWLADDSYNGEDREAQHKAYDAKFTAAAINYVRALIEAGAEPDPSTRTDSVWDVMRPGLQSAKAIDLDAPAASTPQCPASPTGEHEDDADAEARTPGWCVWCSQQILSPGQTQTP